MRKSLRDSRPPSHEEENFATRQSSPPYVFHIALLSRNKQCYTDGHKSYTTHSKSVEMVDEHSEYHHYKKPLLRHFHIYGEEIKPDRY